MMKKIIYTLLISSLGLMALERGDTLPTKVQEELKLENDKVYVLDFFASWCKSCKKELPLVQKVYEANGLNVIAINVDKKREDGEKFVSKLGLTFPVHYDSDKSLVEAFDPMGFPAIYYVKNNQVLKVVFGAVDNIDEQIIKDVEELR
jgi:thiol-disulfide isomerase/thioredoxin